MALLADNQNPDCLLPCWWGATPGKTRWRDIEPFLHSLAQRIYYPYPDKSVGAEVIMPLPESVAVINSSEYHATYGWDESGVIQGISIAPINVAGYDAKMMITLYGVPDEVWLKTFPYLLPGEVLPFHLLIVYQELGISFHYYVDATPIDEMVTVCFKAGIETERPDLYPSSPTIYAWIPGEYKEIDEISYVPWERYYSLEEKTDLTPQKLHEIFTSSDEAPCIDTPADLWR
ncbi:MAG: hypothetical protein KJ063_25735 [Anaerolineae bacterium]|nr:hypothetical protein [Anaerolineae bacterium]